MNAHVKRLLVLAVVFAALFNVGIYVMDVFVLQEEFKFSMFYSIVVPLFVAMIVDVVLGRFAKK